MTVARRAFVDDEHERLARERGYFQAPLLDAAGIDALRAVVDRVFASTKTPFEWANGSFQFTGIHSDLDFVDALYEALAGFLQPHLDRIFVNYHPALAGVFNKPARSSDSGLRSHQDPSLVEVPLRTFVAWVPLVPIDGSNGSFCLLPGSHQLHSFRPVIQPPIFDACDRTLQRLGRPISTTLGDLVVFDAGLVHWSLPNLGAHERPAVQAVMVPREAPFFYPHYDESAKRMELYEMPLAMLRRHPWYRSERPKDWPLLRAFDYAIDVVSEDELVARLAPHNAEARALLRAKPTAQPIAAPPASRRQRLLRQVRTVLGTARRVSKAIRLR